MKPSSETGYGAPSLGDPYLPQAGNGGYRVDRYELDLTYGISSNRLSGRALIALVTNQPLTRLSLDAVGLNVSKVAINGRRAKRYATQGAKLHVWTGDVLPAGARVTLDVRYSANPHPRRGRWGEIGWEELTDGVIVAGQPDGAPTWFPCNDHPSNKATYRIEITTDSPYCVLANGRLTACDVHASQTHWVYEQPEPMSPYLATVQIGRYELVELARRPVRELIAVPASLRPAAEAAFARQTRMMTTFTSLFGPYPFGQYSAIVTADELEIPLEAQSLSIFGANHLHPTYQRLIAHELAHQWFGNSLTVRTWRDIWLQEGFACYAEWLWSEQSGGQSANEHARRHWKRLSDLPQDIVISDPGASRMFDDRLYKRGALTLHALRSTVGDGQFFDLLRGWTAANRHGLVDTPAFVEFAEASTDVDLTDLLSTWLDRPPLPALPS
ncbi:MAG: M1 family metallopeptidase [Actinobacteria bacterium]|nr:M1 family metallopeptidase [Actinomycetota bacterium]